VLYGAVKNGPVALVMAFSILFLGYSNLEKDAEIKEVLNKEKKIGGFYSGISSLEGLADLPEKNFTRGFDIIGITEHWDPASVPLIEKQLWNINRKGSIPMIVWKPDINGKKIYSAICSGKYDEYLKKHALLLRQFKDPVFINFAPGFDNKNKIWSTAGNNTSREFIKAWQYVFSYFNNLGISNVSWVWNPETCHAFQYYPGTEFVDWIGISCLNYSASKKDTAWRDFSQLYLPFKNTFSFIKKPTMITEFGSVNGPDQSLWFQNAFKDIADKFPEVRSTLLYSDKTELSSAKKTHDNKVSDFTLSTRQLSTILDKHLEGEQFEQSPLVKKNLNYLPANTHYKSRFITGKPGTFQMLIDSKPFYVKGERL
jgi:cellulose synthase (UDP-forming)